MYIAKGSRHALLFGLLLMLANNAYPACPESLDFHKRPLNGTQPQHLCDMMSGKVVTATASLRDDERESCAGS